MTRRLRCESSLLSMLALLSGALVYLLARPDSVFALGDLVTYPAWTASLPSFLHTLGFALLCGACAANLRQAAWLALAWGGIEIAAELSQASSAPAIAGLTLRWTFDLNDLAAIGAGTALALLVLLTHPDARNQ